VQLEDELLKRERRDVMWGKTYMRRMKVIKERFTMET
jgi:hypothetical protein